MKILNLVAVLAVFVLASCNTTSDPDDGGNNNLTDVIMPLKVGNQWIFEYTEMDSGGAVIGSGLDTLAIVGEVTINGSTWALLSNFNRDTLSIQNRSNGLFVVDDGEERHEFLYPCKPGDRFYPRIDTLESPDRIVTETYDVETINSSVTVPAGTFSCVKYVASYEEKTIATGNVFRDPRYQVNYVAPNKGIVQLIAYEKETNGHEWMSFRLSLKSITLK